MLSSAVELDSISSAAVRMVTTGAHLRAFQLFLIFGELSLSRTAEEQSFLLEVE